MNLILASKSPRRKFLLEQMGLRFDIIPSKFEEYFDDERPAKEIVEELGLGKAEDVAKNHPNAVVIGSDLVVVVDGKQIGKPENEDEAKQMLSSLSGRTHKLICSVSVVCKSKNYSRVESSVAEVTIKDLSDEFIDKYVATGTTYDKAGGYAMQHPLMKPNIAGIKGRADTIIGLPTTLVSELLADLDISVSELELTPDLLKKAGFTK